jgi:uncharacterized protein (DUF302 family)
MYAFSVELRMPFEQAVEAVMAAVKEEKLGIVSDVDVHAIVRAKLGQEMGRYRILGACAPGLAKRVLDADPEAGALLPCNVIVREIAPELCGVTFMDPVTILDLARNEAIAAVGREARLVLERIRDRLAG